MAGSGATWKEPGMGTGRRSECSKVIGKRSKTPMIFVACRSFDTNKARGNQYFLMWCQTYILRDRERQREREMQCKNHCRIRGELTDISHNVPFSSSRKHLQKFSGNNVFTEISFGRGGGQALESRVLDITAVEGKWSTFHALSKQLTWSHRNWRG